MGAAPQNVQRGNLLFDSIPVWGPEFYIEVEIKINSWISDWGSIFRFTATDGNCCNIGDRIPNLKTKKGTNDKLYLSTQINDKGDNIFSDDLGTFESDVWYKFNISQKKDEVCVTVNCNLTKFEINSNLLRLMDINLKLQLME